MKSLLKLSVLFSLILISCQTMTKESYLEDYKSFITEVRENHTEYSPKDWSKKSAKFNDFSSKWYDKYKDELTWKERIPLYIFGLKSANCTRLNQGCSISLTTKKLTTSKNKSKNTRKKGLKRI